MPKTYSFAYFLTYVFICLLASAHGYGHIENFNRYISTETQGFFNNIFNAQGIQTNIETISSSLSVWYHTLSGSRCSNRIECRDKYNSKLQRTGGKNSYGSRIIDEIDREISNIETQISELDFAERVYKDDNLHKVFLDKNKHHIEKYKKQLKSSISHHRGRKRNLNSGIISEENKVYEDAQNGQYMVFIDHQCAEQESVYTSTTTVYFCNGFRVNEVGYNLYNSDSNYSCNSDIYENRYGCWCRKDESTSGCQNLSTIKCDIHILDPDFSKSCGEDQPDTEFYSFSVPGYDPCHYVDFDNTLNMTYKLKCFDENYSQIKEKWNITYDNFDSNTDSLPDELPLIESQQFNIYFKLQNWNWMSKNTNFASKVTTLKQIYGEENLTVSVDFSKVPKEERRYYSPGGRIHMTISDSSRIFYINPIGFFFELKDYKEPTPQRDIIFILMIIFLSLCLVIFIGLVIYCYWKRSLIPSAESLLNDNAVEYKRAPLRTIFVSGERIE